MGLWNILAAVLVTYWMSRLLLLAARGWIRGPFQLALLHVVSLGLIGAVLALWRWTPAAGYDSGAAVVYALPQLLWFGIDCARQIWRGVRA